MIAYCTKYALTDGITTISGEVKIGMFCVKARYGTKYYHGKDWHLELESAEERARNMRDRKIKSLKKSLARIEALTFGGEMVSTES